VHGARLRHAKALGPQIGEVDMHLLRRIVGSKSAIRFQRDIAPVRLKPAADWSATEPILRSKTDQKAAALWLAPHKMSHVARWTRPEGITEGAHFRC